MRNRNNLSLSKNEDTSVPLSVTLSLSLLIYLSLSLSTSLLTMVPRVLPSTLEAMQQMLETSWERDERQGNTNHQVGWWASMFSPISSSDYLSSQKLLQLERLRNNDHADGTTHQHLSEKSNHSFYVSLISSTFKQLYMYMCVFVCVLCIVMLLSGAI